jgi:NADH-quinone oxidoreductase subunit N
VQPAVAEYGRSVGLLIGVLAAVTMTFGNLAALRQASLKRLLAYSSIAHAGYTLIGVATMTPAGFQAAMYYLAAYYLMNLGAFGFLLYFEGVTGSDDVDALRGLGPRSPLVSTAMIVFLISLTGLPPTVGFYGKYLLFQEGIDAGLLWLVVVAGLNSVVSLFYYFRVAKALFLAEPAEREVVSQPLIGGFLGALAAGTVLFCLYAAPIEDWARASMDLIARAG